MVDISRRNFQLGALASVLAWGPAKAAAAWPPKVVHVVIPFAPGGSTDAITRSILDHLNERIGTNFIMEYRGGAGSAIGTMAVAGSPPDGTMLLSTTASFVTAPIVENVKYSVHSFDSIAMLARSPFVVLVNANSPVKTIKDLIEFARHKEGGALYATAGFGSSTHFCTEYFNMRAGVKMRHVPYRGIGPAMQGLLSGDVDVMITTPASSAGQVKAGLIRIVAYTSPGVPVGFPQAPTVKDAGLDYETSSWWAVLAPRGTPMEIREKLNGAINDILKMTDVIKRISNLGCEPAPMSLAAFSKLIDDESALWAEVAKFGNIKAEK